MKPAPKGWPRISTSITYNDPAKAIDWLCAAFGFEVRLKIEGENGSIEHSELTYGDALIMVGGVKDRFPHRKSPKSLGGANTQNLVVYVDDAKAHVEHAEAHGAVILDTLKVHDYGDEYWVDQTYEAEDLEGHHWWFAERLRDAK